MRDHSSLRDAVRAFAVPIGLFVIGGCRPTGSADEPTSLSPFQENAPISGRVVENVRLCEVDADCFLRIEFADTTLTALYGTGDRPRPPCRIGVETSDVAFTAEEGDVLRLEIGRCGEEGYYIAGIEF